jgi:uncharacterized small protein (DUF1192 family)
MSMHLPVTASRENEGWALYDADGKPIADGMRADDACSIVQALNDSARVAELEARVAELEAELDRLRGQATAAQRVVEAAWALVEHDTAPDTQGVYLRQPISRGTRIRLDALWTALQSLVTIRITRAVRSRRGSARE